MAQQINPADLDVSQLAQVKKQLEDELSHLTSSFGQLKQAQSKFRACIDNVQEIKPANKDKPILVPLTNSLYVPGKLADTEYVIVDVGTGYFVRKTRAQAAKYYKDKVEYIGTNLTTLQDTVQKKQENLNYIVGVLQSKLQETASSGGAQSGSQVQTQKSLES